MSIVELASVGAIFLVAIAAIWWIEYRVGQIAKSALYQIGKMAEQAELMYLCRALSAEETVECLCWAARKARAQSGPVSEEDDKMLRVCGRKSRLLAEVPGLEHLRVMVIATFGEAK